MASITAENVAKDVVKTLENQGKVVLGKILKNNGYSKAVISNPKNVTETDSYKNAMALHIQRMQKHRDKILKAMEAKDLSQEDYRILSEAFDRMNKTMLLAQGKSTENVAVSVQVVDYSNTQ